MSYKVGDRVYVDQHGLVNYREIIEIKGNCSDSLEYLVAYRDDWIGTLNAPKSWVKPEKCFRNIEDLRSTYKDDK